MVRRSLPMTLEETIGLQIRWRRLQLGLRQGELARKARLSASAMSKIENGRMSTTVASLKGIAEALEMPINLLFSPIGTEPLVVHGTGHVPGRFG